MCRLMSVKRTETAPAESSDSCALEDTSWSRSLGFERCFAGGVGICAAWEAEDAEAESLAEEIAAVGVVTDIVIT